MSRLVDKGDEGQQMKTCIVIAIGVVALFSGLKAALLWRDSTNVPCFRPVPNL
jgi:hypothetical protein